MAFKELVLNSGYILQTRYDKGDRDVTEINFMIFFPPNTQTTAFPDASRGCLESFEM